MKRKFGIMGIVLVLVLSLSLIPAVPALAWDEEDPCIAANEDFIAGGGWDNGTPEFHSGAQPWPPGKAPNEGYNLYQDDVSGTGNLDRVFILTFTPDEVDLPTITSYGPYPNEGIDEYWYMGDEETPDTYYWATEPRGWDFTKAEVLIDRGVPGKGLDTAPGLQRPFNPNSQAGNNAGK